VASTWSGTRLTLGGAASGVRQEEEAELCLVEWRPSVHKWGGHLMFPQLFKPQATHTDTHTEPEGKLANYTGYLPT
jgi:hypothetical protein